MDKEFSILYEEANKLSGKVELNSIFKYKHVGCALMTKGGNIYTGISIKAPSGMGFCAEKAAIAEMLKNDEYIIKKIVAVRDGRIVSPCGSCREFIRDLTEENLDTQVLIDENKIVTMGELLPHLWIP